MRVRFPSPAPVSTGLISFSVIFGDTLVPKSASQRTERGNLILVEFGRFWSSFCESELERGGVEPRMTRMTRMRAEWPQEGTKRHEEVIIRQNSNFGADRCR